MAPEGSTWNFTILGSGTPDPFFQASIRQSCGRPRALTADVADGQALLEWNPGLEDDLAGYRVYRRAPERSGFEPFTPHPIEWTTFTDAGLVHSPR